MGRDDLEKGQTNIAHGNSGTGISAAAPAPSQTGIFSCASAVKEALLYPPARRFEMTNQDGNHIFVFRSVILLI
jgi:hypothetical protein